MTQRQVSGRGRRRNPIVTLVAPTNHDSPRRTAWGVYKWTIKPRSPVTRDIRTLDPKEHAVKVLPICLVATVVLLSNAARGQYESRSPTTSDTQPQFLESGKWWNLYFADENDPLGTIKAVKVVQLCETHPSWVQIAFPKKQKEHFSILKPAARAHDDPSIDFEDAIAEWERSVSEWKVIWINLNFVVHMNKVEQRREPEHSFTRQPK